MVTQPAMVPPLWLFKGRLAALVCLPPTPFVSMVVQEPIGRSGLSSPVVSMVVRDPFGPISPFRVSMVVTDPPGRSGLSSPFTSMALEAKPEAALARRRVSMVRVTPLWHLPPSRGRCALPVPNTATLAPLPPPRWSLHPGPFPLRACALGATRWRRRGRRLRRVRAAVGPRGRWGTAGTAERPPPVRREVGGRGSGGAGGGVGGGGGEVKRGGPEGMGGAVGLKGFVGRGNRGFIGGETEGMWG